MRLGTSTTSFTHGFNIVEYNYMEDERLEAETISNKSWDNIYRFNTFVGNDGGMVIRHGQKCFVYGNYVNGKSGRNNSAGLRIINPNNTVFNNYVENIEGGNKGFRSAIAIMAGLEGSAINGYYPADNAIVAYNTLVRADGPAIRVGIGNSSKGKGLVAPKNVLIVGNSIIETLGSNINPVEVDDSAATFTSRDNAYTNGTTTEKGFYVFSGKKLNQKNGLTLIPHVSDMAVIDTINQRLAIHHIKLSEKQITQFDPSYKIDKKVVGVSWIKL
jgi:poly(beta-D-mannuronate) lyase